MTKKQELTIVLATDMTNSLLNIVKKDLNNFKNETGVELLGQEEVMMATYFALNQLDKIFMEKDVGIDETIGNVAGLLINRAAFIKGLVKKEKLLNVKKQQICSCYS